MPYSIKLAAHLLQSTYQKKHFFYLIQQSKTYNTSNITNEPQLLFILINQAWNVESWTAVIHTYRQ